MVRIRPPCILPIPEHLRLEFIEIDDGSSLQDFIHVKRDLPERLTIKQWYQQRHPNTHVQRQESEVQVQRDIRKPQDQQNPTCRCIQSSHSLRSNCGDAKVAESDQISRTQWTRRQYVKLTHQNARIRLLQHPAGLVLRKSKGGTSNSILVPVADRGLPFDTTVVRLSAADQGSGIPTSSSQL